MSEEIRTTQDTAPLRAAEQRQQQRGLQQRAAPTLAGGGIGGGGASALAARDVVSMYSFVQSLGIDPVKESEMIWIAEEALDVQLPPGWAEHIDDRGHRYYHSSLTGESSWVHPMEDVFADIVNYFRQVEEEGNFWSVEDDLAEHEDRIRRELSEWKELFDHRGQKFFYNQRTEESKREDPRHAAYHCLYARIKLVNKMREHLPQYANVPRPEDPAVTRERERRQKEQRDIEAATLLFQSIARGTAGTLRANRERERRRRNVAPPAERSWLSVHVQRDVNGAQFREDLVITMTEQRRYELSIVRCQAFIRGCLARIRTHPMIQHRRKLEREARKIQRVYRQHRYRIHYEAWKQNLANMLRPLPARRRAWQEFDAAVDEYNYERRLMMKAVLRIQTMARVQKAKQKADEIRRRLAAVFILTEAYHRGVLRSAEIHRQRRWAAGFIQRVARGWKVRRTRNEWQPVLYQGWLRRQERNFAWTQAVMNMRLHQARLIAAMAWSRTYEAALAIQCAIRQALARRRFAIRKEEHRIETMTITEKMEEVLNSMQLEVSRTVDEYLCRMRVRLLGLPAVQESSESEEEIVRVPKTRKSRLNRRPLRRPVDVSAAPELPASAAPDGPSSTAEAAAPSRPAVSVASSGHDKFVEEGAYSSADDASEGDDEGAGEMGAADTGEEDGGGFNRATMALFGIAGPGGEVLSAGLDFDRTLSEQPRRSIAEIERELAECEADDDGMRSPTPTPEPSEAPEEEEEEPEPWSEAIEEEEPVEAEPEEERPETPPPIVEEVKVPARPKNHYYYGCWKKGTFERAKITSADQFTQLDKQDILKDLADARQQKIDELMRREKKRAAKLQRRQEQAKERMKAASAQAWRLPKQSLSAPSLATAEFMPKRAPHANELDPRLGARLVVDDRRRRWHAQLRENNDVTSRSIGSLLEPVHIPAPSLIKKPPQEAAAKLPVHRHMHVHVHQHHDDLWAEPGAAAAVSRDGAVPESLPRINSKASYVSRSSQGGLMLGSKLRALSEADLMRPSPYEPLGFSSPPSASSKSSWRMPALHADGVLAGR